MSFSTFWGKILHLNTKSTSGPHSFTGLYFVGYQRRHAKLCGIHIKAFGEASIHILKVIADLERCKTHSLQLKLSLTSFDFLTYAKNDTLYSRNVEAVGMSSYNRPTCLHFGEAPVKKLMGGFHQTKRTNQYQPIREFATPFIITKKLLN